MLRRVKKGLQGVREGCRWWQWVTRAYRGLKKVTGGYKGLQGGKVGVRK